MSLIIVVDKKESIHSIDYIFNFASNFEFIFNKAYGNNFSSILTFDKLYESILKKGDFVLLTFFPDLKKLKAINKFVKEKNSFLGIYFGDSQQYLDNIFAYYCNFLDFCFTGEVGEAYMYEAFCGLAAFHHPVCAIRNIDYFKSSKISDPSKNRFYDFVHIGRFDNERKGRLEIKQNLLKINSNYLLLGPSDGCELVKTSELHKRISECNFGLVNCASPESSPLSSRKINNQFQFKGKIWEYILAGCIPVLDYAPNTYRFGFKEGIHYIRLDSFSKANLEKLLKIDQKGIQKMRNSLFSLAEKQCSTKSLKESFDDFQSSSMLFAPKKTFRSISKEILLNACYDYSMKRKRFSLPIIFSGFYFFKIMNKIRQFYFYK